MTILIVASESSSLKLAALYLARQGHRVYFSSTAESAMSLADNLDDDIDILIGDLNLPDGNLMESACWLMSNAPDMGAILATESPMSQWSITDSAIFTYLRSESVRVIQQPFAASELLALINELAEPPAAPSFWERPLIRPSAA